MSDMSNFYITEEKMNEYMLNLKNDERADNTVEKYIRDIKAFTDFLNGNAVAKEKAIDAPSQASIQQKYFRISKNEDRRNL